MAKKKAKKKVVTRNSVPSKKAIKIASLSGKENKNSWFRIREGSKDKWGFIPINWKGTVALILLIGFNVYAANYFRLNELVLDSYLKMGVVFLLSVFIFIEIAKKRTRV